MLEADTKEKGKTLHLPTCQARHWKDDEPPDTNYGCHTCHLRKAMHTCHGKCNAKQYKDCQAFKDGYHKFAKSSQYLLAMSTGSIILLLTWSLVHPDLVFDEQEKELLDEIGVRPFAAS